MNQYLFLLGRNASLSRAELNVFCEEILYDGTTGLLLGGTEAEEDPEVFLGRLGGVVRMASVVGEYQNENDVLYQIASHVQAQKPEGKVHLGISVFGMPQKRLRFLCPTVKTLLKEKFGRNTRTVNRPGANLESGQIFGSRLLSKGFEFVIWKRGNSFLLCQTVANQDIESYTIRDREKPFRDSKMGMLPPKLAQVLVNLAGEGQIIDPFCGSGTIAIEAALMGRKSLNSDLNRRFIAGAQQNFSAMSDRLGINFHLAQFEVSDALALPWQEMSGCVVTEGYLGINFERRPSPNQVRQQAAELLSLWEKLFVRIAEGDVQTVCCCLPNWQQGAGGVSIAGKLFESIKPLGFVPQAIFDGQKSFVYKRERTFVGREVVGLKNCNYPEIPDSSKRRKA